jgi:hypothetical protein
MNDLKPFKSFWKKYNRMIVTNEWNDMKKRVVINILVFSYKRSIFFNAINTLDILGVHLIGDYIF